MFETNIWINNFISEEMSLFFMGLTDFQEESFHQEIPLNGDERQASLLLSTWLIMRTSPVIKKFG